MTTSERKNIVKFLSDKESRDEYVSAHIETGVAFQIKENRVSRDLTQQDLGKLAGMMQTAISRLESGGSLPKLETLVRLASAFDVGLLVRFVPFSELIDWSGGLGERSLSSASFDEDRRLRPRGSISRDSAVRNVVYTIDSPRMVPTKRDDASEETEIRRERVGNNAR